MAQGVQENKTIAIKPISDYLFYLPDGYADSSLQEWPVMLFLHGAGERGNDLSKVKTHGPPKLIAQGQELPFIIVSPQCPPGRWWSVDDLNILLEQIEGNYRVDKDRIYVTGLSMGGFATWDLAIKYPNRFAAIVPICGGGNPEKARHIKDVPAWVFHGAKDNVVPLKYSEEMVEALKENGSNVKFTVYPEANHDSWTKTYNNPEVFEWLLQQSRPNQWAEEFKAFEKQDKNNPPEEVDVLFTGSSSIRMWESLPNDFPDLNVLNRGFGGSEIEDLLNYPKKLIIKYQPKKVVIYSGDNDINSGKTPEEVLRDFRTLFHTLRKQLPDTEILYISIKPSIARINKLEEMKKANEDIKRFLTNNENATYVDVFSPMLDKNGQPREEFFIEDGLHLNQKGYKLWKKILDPFI